METKQRPEALAQFAESARQGERTGVSGLTATEATAPIPTPSKAKDDAATRVLAEGATGQDFSSEEAIERLPDRILESQEKSGLAGDEDGQSTSIPDRVEAPYDATRDPRTGRPPTPLEAQRLARDNELEQLRRAQIADEAADDDVDLEEAQEGSSTDETNNIGTEEVEAGEAQRPARMTSPDRNEEEETAVDLLVQQQGITRERAEELVEQHGVNMETLKAAAWVDDNLPDSPSS